MVAIGPPPDVSYLRERNCYDPDTGLFTWRMRELIGIRDHQWNGKWAGRVAGCLHYKGYISIRFDGKIHRAHRLAWLYMTGEWPDLEVDHEDTNKQNNKWKNLRLATFHQNQQNKKTSAANKSGVKGVCWSPDRNCWRAVITVKGRYINIGRFEDIEDAKRAYNQAAVRHHGEFANVG